MKNIIYISYNLSFIGIQRIDSDIGSWVLLFLLALLLFLYVLSIRKIIPFALFIAEAR